ncbi:MAG: hypothetical protein ACLT98_15460 [Eggerthellaceae bacterium]
MVTSSAFVDDHGERAVRGSGLVGAIALPFENALHVLPVSLRGDVDIGEGRPSSASRTYPPTIHVSKPAFRAHRGRQAALRQRDDDGRIEVGLVAAWRKLLSFASYTNISERSS